MIPGLFLYLVAFFVIWLGSGLIIHSIDKIARQLKLSSFAISFFILGILTSIPEAALGFSAIADKQPEIFVGTLLGGVVVIYLLVIPILAILGKGIPINHGLSKRNLILTLAVTLAPSVLVLDKKVTNAEGLILILLYILLFYIIQQKKGLLDKDRTDIFKLKAYSLLDLAKVVLGIGLVFVSSQFIVNQTIIFSQIFSIPTFYISLVILSFGTNLPELSLAVRSILSGKKDIAFGDYLGSAAANTLLFGFFTLLNVGEVITVNNFFVTFIFIATGLTLFYFLSNSKNEISVKEGFYLLVLYLLFVIIELGGGDLLF